MIYYLSIVPTPSLQWFQKSGSMVNPSPVAVTVHKGMAVAVIMKILTINFLGYFSGCIFCAHVIHPPRVRFLIMPITLFVV